MNRDKIKDKFKIAADLKRNNPNASHPRAMFLAKEVERMFLDGHDFEKAMKWAREMI